MSEQGFKARAEPQCHPIPARHDLARALARQVLGDLGLQDVLALQRPAATVEHHEHAVRAVDVVGGDDDELAMVEQVVGQPLPLHWRQVRQLGHEMLARREDRLLGRHELGFVRRHVGARTRCQHETGEKGLLAVVQAQLEHVAGPDQVVQATAQRRCGVVGEIAQHGGQDGQGGEALLAVDDFARAAFIGSRAVAEQPVWLVAQDQDGAEKVVEAVLLDIVAGRRHEILEQLPRLLDAP